ncbi:MAG TPA: helix-turn-helix domain-containing protein [Propionibacteriaceae bacterium]|nr:helix-turn-helix domain-containing protein [Propionibacteriaceae bacterium]
MSDKGRRIVGDERAALAKELAERYAEGENIRQLAAATGRSYGFVNNVLTEAGVQLRGRGGARWGTWRHGPTATASHDQLVATLAAQHPGERLTWNQARATLRAVHGNCSGKRAGAAAREHNARLTPAEGTQR